jgi:hypothetical protein
VSSGRRFDPLRHEFLQVPEVSVTYAVLVQVRDGVVEILGTRAPMATGFSYNVSDHFRGEPAGIELRLPVHHKGKGAK